MTEVNQNFTMYAGETKNIIVPNTKDDGSDLDLTGTTLKWILKKSIPPVVKKSPEISTMGNVLTIPLEPSDTVNLSGTYEHECELTDQMGNVSILFAGILTIKL